MKSNLRMKCFVYGCLLVALTNYTKYGFTQSVNLTSIYEKARKAVFKINVINSDGKIAKIGTGFFISSTGTALTNYHVLKNAWQAQVVLYDGTIYSLESIKGFSMKKDLIKFNIQNPKGRKFDFIVQDPLFPRIGDEILVIGNPNGFNSSLSTGIISGLRNNDENISIIQITAPISHGNSGSPVINKDGKYLGVVSYSIKDAQNLNFAISAKEVNSLSNSSSSNLSYFNSVEEDDLIPDNLVESTHYSNLYSGKETIKKYGLRCENITFYPNLNLPQSERLKSSYIPMHKDGWSCSSIYFKKLNNEIFILTIGSNLELQASGEIFITLSTSDINSGSFYLLYDSKLKKNLFSIKNGVRIDKAELALNGRKFILTIKNDWIIKAILEINQEGIESFYEVDEYNE